VGVRFVIAAAVSLLSVGLFAATIASVPVQGIMDVAWQSAGDCALRITGVSDALKAQGLKVGDVLQLDKMTSASRTRLFFPPPAGESIAWPVQRDGRQHDLTLNFSPVPGYQPLGPLIRLSFILLGLIALWRGRDKASLGLGVFFCGISSILGPGYAVLSPTQTYWAGAVISLLTAVALVGMVSMTIALTSAYLPPRWLSIARIASPLIAVVHLSATLTEYLQLAGSGCTASWQTPVQIGAFSGQMLIAMTLLGAAARMAPPVERSRVRWIYWRTCVGFLGPFIGVILIAFHLPQPTFDWFNLTILAIPFGYTYAVLRHRLIDVGIVINRALVYGIMTTFIVGILAISESLLAYAAIGKNASLTVELVVAGLFGLSFNALHKRIDTAVDRVFFKQKHEAEAALGRLALESAFIEKPGALLDRAADEIYLHAGARSVSLYEREGDGYRCVRVRGDVAAPDAIDVDDPAFVRMRATLRDIELDDVGSALGPRGLAVPMVVRGALLGALVLGPRTTDEPYAPDERTLLLRVAHEIAAALHAMQAREHADLVGALATGLIDPSTAQSRAREIRALT
jgi:hypothetical protein